MTVAIKEGIHSTASSSPFILTSQSIRVIGAAAGIAFFLVGHESRWGDALLATATTCSTARLPFHAMRAMNKGIQSKESNKSWAEAGALGFGALFLTARCFGIGARLADLHPLTAQIGVAVALFKGGEILFSSKVLYDHCQSKESLSTTDYVKIANTCLLIVGGPALLFIPVPYNRLVANVSSLIIGLNIMISAWPAPKPASKV